MGRVRRHDGADRVAKVSVDLPTLLPDVYALSVCVRARAIVCLVPVPCPGELS
jgi:hypothetical protein